MTCESSRSGCPSGPPWRKIGFSMLGDRLRTSALGAPSLATLALATLALATLAVACGDDAVAPIPSSSSSSSTTSGSATSGNATSSVGTGGAGGATASSSASGSGGGALPETFVVQGIVTEEGRPLEGASVLQGGGAVQQVTGPDGAFTIELLSLIHI